MIPKGRLNLAKIKSTGKLLTQFRNSQHPSINSICVAVISTVNMSVSVDI